MAYTPESLILGPSSGTSHAWFEWAKSKGAIDLTNVGEYISRVYELAPLLGIRAELVVAQSVHETSDPRTGIPWSSYWWKTRRNPAGLGITGDPVQDSVSRTFPSGREAAEGHLAHIYLYAVGATLPAGLEYLADEDPRWDAASSLTGIVGRKKRLVDFGGSTPSSPTWAADPAYGQKWSNKLNELAPVLGLQETGEAQVADHIYMLSAGHRNWDRGGAYNEINWTYGSCVFLKQAIEARGGKAYIVQELDSDGDKTFFAGGLQAAAYKAASLASTLGPFTAYLSSHYNGGASRGAMFIFPDSWGPGDQKADNPWDVQLCRIFTEELLKTNTVPMIAWTADRPGVMSERETGVGAQGYRLGEFVGTLGIRESTVRVIMEAGSIDVPGDAKFINDPNWVRYVYCEAIVNGLERMFGPFPKKAPAPVPVPVPSTGWNYPDPLAYPVLDALKVEPVDTTPAFVTIPDTTYRAIWVGDRVRAIRDTNRLRTPDTGNTSEVGPVIKSGEEFAVDYLFVSVGDKDYKPRYRTPGGTFVLVEDTKRVKETK